MSAPAPPRPPRLTEVVDVTKNAPGTLLSPTPAGAAASATASEDQLIEQVLADVQRQIDAVLEVRLREALAPILSRLTDALLRETRAELASTLREVVARAVAQELSRHRAR